MNISENKIYRKTIASYFVLAVIILVFTSLNFYYNHSILKFIFFEAILLIGIVLWIIRKTRKYLVGNMLAISKTKDSAEDKLIEQTMQLLFTALESAANSIMITDKSGNIQWVNNAFTLLSGYSKEEVVGKNPRFLKSNKLDPKFYQDLWETILSGKIWSGRLENLRKNGTSYIDESMITPVTDNNGEITHFIAIKQDVTDRIKSENQLKELEQKYRSFFEDDVTGDYITTTDGQILMCNPAFAEMFRFSSVKEALHTKTANLYRDVNTLQVLLSKLVKYKKLNNYEVEMVRKDGSSAYMIANYIGVFDKSGMLQEIKAYLIDDTRRRMLENQLIQTQKMDGIGTFASGIAHDFNNILGIILGHASLIEAQNYDIKVEEKSNQAITEAALRGAEVVKQLLTFTRKTEIFHESVQINDVVSDVMKLIGETFPKTINTILHLEENLPALVADRTQLHQVLFNLCVNARDAMPQGGELHISTQLKKNTQDYITLKVRDTGTGMEEKVINRIYEPFFTTKDFNQGTGLGLSVVFGIIQNHKGFIEVKSNLGEGSEFIISLPLINNEIIIENNKNTDYTIIGGNETILVIEDEQSLRDLMKEFLISNGYNVITATNGEEGLIIYKQNISEIKLVFSDVGLPKIDGLTLFENMKAIHPEVKTILTSGFLESNKRSEIINAGVKDFIQKPYHPEEVLRKIRKILDSHSSRKSTLHPQAPTKVHNEF
ncbi:MAG: PAS domain S-box protein [Bacteroidota bacterium]|nr:PAS domain S-box protein [Bacteroidota bacterium]